MYPMLWIMRLVNQHNERTTKKKKNNEGSKIGRRGVTICILLYTKKSLDCELSSGISRRAFELHYCMVNSEQSVQVISVSIYT